MSFHAADALMEIFGFKRVANDEKPLDNQPPLDDDGGSLNEGMKMEEATNMPASIDCWACGTYMTLDEHSENDGYCPECNAEIDLDPYLAKALAVIAEREARIAEQDVQIKVLQSDANSWQSGYDEGRRMGGKHCMLTADQHAQRTVELEWLLLRVQVSLSLDDTEWGYSGAEKYKLLADIRAALIPDADHSEDVRAMVVPDIARFEKHAMKARECLSECDVVLLSSIRRLIASPAPSAVVMPDALSLAFITCESVSDSYRVVIKSKTLEETQSIHNWIVRVCPSGDCCSVQEQWLASSDYACLYTDPVISDRKLPEMLALIRDVTNISEACYYMPKSWRDRVIALSLAGKIDVQAAKQVVMPELFVMQPYQTVDKGSTNYKAGFNAATKEIARLNAADQEGDQDE